LKLQCYFLAFLVLTLAANGAYAQPSDNPFEGCISPVKIAPALEMLRDSKWKNVNMARVQAIWPAELFSTPCNLENCLRLDSKEQMGKKDYCGEAFHFKGMPGSGVEELGTFYVEYLSSNKKDAIEAARIMAKASGVSDDDLANQGKKRKQHYFWDTKYNEPTFINVNIVRLQGIWSVLLTISRYYK
jgi:hypothetical protein